MEEHQPTPTIAPAEGSGAEVELGGGPTHVLANQTVGSPSRLAVRRLLRNSVAMACAFFLAVLAAVAFCAAEITHALGVDPNTRNAALVDSTMVPLGRFGGVSLHHPFGVEPASGRDLFARVLIGSQVSLGVSLAGTAVMLVLGTFFGLIAGYAGGWLDLFVSRVMDVVLAFPILFLALALVGVLPESVAGLSGNHLRVAILVAVIGFSGWPYVGRLVRGLTLSLRERDFVSAARCLGASDAYILRRELLPNLVGPVLVYATLLIPGNILFESALSFLGVGVAPPLASWGGLLSDAVHYPNCPHFILAPGLAITCTVLAFNVLGDALRDAFDPRATRN